MYKAVSRGVQRFPRTAPKNRHKGLVDPTNYVIVVFYMGATRQQTKVFRVLRNLERLADANRAVETHKGFRQLYKRQGESFIFIREEGDAALRTDWEQLNPKRLAGPEGGKHW